MGWTDSLSIDSLPNINWGAMGNWAIIVFVSVVMFIIAVLGIFFYYRRKVVALQFRHKIPIFTNLNGKHKRIGIDSAREVFIPDSNISLFFLKGRKLYIARPTRAMGENEYWYSISPNGEWINFDLSLDLDDETVAQTNYDHRDTRYAYTNLKEIIKRNYKDKAVQWWKEYSHIITFIIVSIIFVGSCWILLAKIGGLIEALGPIAEQFERIADTMSGAVKNAQNINSGVASG